MSRRRQMRPGIARKVLLTASVEGHTTTPALIAAQMNLTLDSVERVLTEAGWPDVIQVQASAAIPDELDDPDEEAIRVVNLVEQLPALVRRDLPLLHAMTGRLSNRRLRALVHVMAAMRPPDVDARDHLTDYEVPDPPSLAEAVA